MPVEPDTKDWTWVIHTPCPECGFDASLIDVATIGERTRAIARQWVGELAPPGASDRVSADRWSTLEYGCHVRDVFSIYDERLALMFDVADPTFDDWDQDRAAVEQRYDLQDPAVVSQQLCDAGERVAARFDAVTGSGWARTGTRSNGSSFRVDTLGLYFIHDPMHHLFDVTGEPCDVRGRLPERE